MDGATPHTRIRVNHNRTQRDGWQYETTVEVQFGGDRTYGADGAQLERLAVLLEQARHLGEAERDVRNERDGQR